MVSTLRSNRAGALIALRSIALTRLSLGMPTT
jgi:hypothetical protein